MQAARGTKCQAGKGGILKGAINSDVRALEVIENVCVTKGTTVREERSTELIGETL